MNYSASSTFEIKGWDEQPYNELGASKLTRATVKKTYRGDMEGEEMLQYLMAYKADGSASFVGIERFQGRVGDKQGDFVFQHVGTFEKGIAQSIWSVVPDSGQGEFQGLRGEVNCTLGHEKEYHIVFQYEFN